MPGSPRDARWHRAWRAAGRRRRRRTPAMTDTGRQRVVEATYREATAKDVEAIAGLHADSWRRHYRGAYSDAFLDGDVITDRVAVWTDRLTQPQPEQCTIVADCDGAVIGFAHTLLDDDPTWPDPSVPPLNLT